MSDAVKAARSLMDRGFGTLTACHLVSKWHGVHFLTLYREVAAR